MAANGRGAAAAAAAAAAMPLGRPARLASLQTQLSTSPLLQAQVAQDELLGRAGHRQGGQRALMAGSRASVLQQQSGQAERAAAQLAWGLLGSPQRAALSAMPPPKLAPCHKAKLSTMQAQALSALAAKGLPALAPAGIVASAAASAAGLRLHRTLHTSTAAATVSRCHAG